MTSTEHEVYMKYKSTKCEVCGEIFGRDPGATTTFCAFMIVAEQGFLFKRMNISHRCPLRPITASELQMAFMLFLPVSPNSLQEDMQ